MSKATFGLGRRPRGLLFVSTGATDEGISTSDATLSIGAAGTGGGMGGPAATGGGTGSTVNDAIQGAYGHGVFNYMQDNVTTTATSTVQIPSIPLWVGPNALTQYAAVQSLDADGYTLAWANTTDPVSRRFWSVAFGDPVTPAAPTLGTLPPTEGLLPRLVSVARLSGSGTTAMGNVGIWGNAGRQLFAGPITPNYDCWVEVYSNITFQPASGADDAITVYHVLAGSQFFDAYPYGQPRTGAGSDMRGLSFQASFAPMLGTRWTNAPLKTLWRCEAGKTYQWFLASQSPAGVGLNYYDSASWSYIYASIVGYA